MTTQAIFIHAALILSTIQSKTPNNTYTLHNNE